LIETSGILYYTGRKYLKPMGPEEESCGGNNQTKNPRKMTFFTMRDGTNN
jgi:hypothetical protein